MTGGVLLSAQPYQGLLRPAPKSTPYGTHSKSGTKKTLKKGQRMTKARKKEIIIVKTALSLLLFTRGMAIMRG
jgi:hypothetical protein